VVIGFAPICVRHVDGAGPAAIGMWRLLFALPVLALAARVVPAPVPVAGAARWGWIAGLCFAGDLATWHWSIRLTGVAHATLFSNCAPVVLAAGLWLLGGIRPGLRLIGVLVVATIGVALLAVDPGAPGPGPGWGAVTGLVSAGFYAGYQLAIARAAAGGGAVRAMACSSAVGAAALAVTAFAGGESMLPASAAGWVAAALLGLVVHAGGQGLIAQALPALPPGPASVVLLLQPVVAALAAWPLCGERPGPWQAAGGALVLAAAVLARRSVAAPPAPP
jgi:drug/metabolite transporter (DMT)-like permease